MGETIKGYWLDISGNANYIKTYDKKYIYFFNENAKLMDEYCNLTIRDGSYLGASIRQELGLNDNDELKYTTLPNESRLGYEYKYGVNIEIVGVIKL